MKTIKVFAQYALMPPFSMKTIKLKRICTQDMHLIPLGSLINDEDVADNIISTVGALSRPSHRDNQPVHL